MRSTSAPYVLLLVVKSGHVGSDWLAELVNKQRFGAFKHEANACVRSQQLVSGLVTGAGCSKITIRDNSSLPLLGLSFNGGMFGESAIETWKAALHATPPTVPIMVVSLTRTNTIKWAWSVYRHQAFNQTSHVRSNNASASAQKPFEPVRAEPRRARHLAVPNYYEKSLSPILYLTTTPTLYLVPTRTLTLRCELSRRASCRLRAVPNPSPSPSSDPKPDP